jgi:recombination protein RecT
MAEKKGTTARRPNEQDSRALAQNIASDLQKHLKRLTNMLAGTYITPQRYLSIVMDGLSRNPKLLQCSRQSILRAVMDCAEMGLEPGTRFGFAHLVPFWNKNLNGYECQAIPGYQGKLELVLGCGAATAINAFMVHERDHFRMRYGLNPSIEHEPYIDGDPGKARGVYAIASTPGSDKATFVYLTAADVAKVIEFVKRKNNGKLPEVWTGELSADEMWKKTALHRLCKLLRKTTRPEAAPRLEKALALDSAALGFDELFAGAEALPPMPEDLDGKGQESRGAAGDSSAEADDKPKATDIIGPEQVKALSEAYAKRFGEDETWIKAKLAKIGKDETTELTYQQFEAWMRELLAMESRAAAPPAAEATPQS